MTIGVNIESEELQDAAQNGIFDHILIKEWQMKLGEANLTCSIFNPFQPSTQQSRFFA